MLSMPAKDSRGQICSRSIANTRGSRLGQFQQGEVELGFSTPALLVK
jgi:hypothetical protein